MDSMRPFSVLMVLILVRSMVVLGTNSCEFPAVYNFGDSNSDTGAMSAAMQEVPPPNGETFFGHPAGRYCDGPLIIDFIAENLKLPFLSPYLDSIGTNFRHGANFAAAGSSILPPGFSPFPLGTQISQFLRYKSRMTALYNSGKSPPLKTGLARPGDFSKALYTIDIGQNDLWYGFLHANQEQILASIPHIVNNYSQAVQQLYKEGARFFWIHNTGPIGCLPYSVIYAKSNPNNLDQNGCVKVRNEMAREYNRQLKEKISQLGVQLPNAIFTYVDVYSAKYSLISNARRLGFVDPVNFCCGSYYRYHIDCGKRAVVNGTVYGNPCDHPSMHISWDGIHYSEAANLWIAKRILNGSFSDPPVPLARACYHSRYT